MKLVPQRLQLIGLILVLIVVAVLRFCRLTEIAPGIAYDEAGDVVQLGKVSVAP